MIATTELRMGARRFQALVQNLGDLVTVHDAQGRIQYATPSTARLLGYPEDQLIGKNAFELIHPDDMDIAHAAFARVLELRNHGMPTEYRVRQAGGAWIDVETVGTNFLEDPVVRGIVLTSRIITERKRHERQLLAISTVASALRTANTRDEMLPIILDQVIRLVNADGAALAMRDAATGEAVIRLGRGSAEGLTGRKLLASEGVLGQVIQSAQSYYSEDILVEPLFAGMVPTRRSADGRVAAIAMPLMANDKPIGALWVQKESPADEQGQLLDDEQIQLLTAIAEMSANAIHRATLNEQTQLRLHRLMVLQNIDLAISQSVDLQMTLNLLLGEIISRLRIDAADVFVIDPTDGRLKCAASRGFTTGFVSRSDAPLRRGPNRRALMEQRTNYVTGNSPTQLPPEILPMFEAEGFQTYYGLPLISSGRTVGLLELFQRTPMPSDREWTDYLDGLAVHVALAVEKVSLIQDLQKSNSELMNAYDGVIEGWSHALALRDHETVEHAKRVTSLTLQVARAVGVEPQELTNIRRGAMLHDIGKIALPDAILLKREPLTEEDWDVLRRHPSYAYDLMAPIDYLKPALDIPYCHHERWDGKGYPRGLKGAEIPLAAQVFSIVDVYDALTSDRPYRAAWSPDEALAYIREQAGTRFNPELVEAFMKTLPSAETSNGQANLTK